MEDSWNDMREQTRWLVLCWKRPTKSGEKGSWDAWTAIQKIPYWAIYNLIAQGSISKNDDALVMVHAMPPNVESRIPVVDAQGKVPEPHWFTVEESTGSNIIGVYIRELPESEFIKRLEKQAVFEPIAKTKKADAKAA